jgi:hypothetical protein
MKVRQHENGEKKQQTYDLKHKMTWETKVKAGHNQQLSSLKVLL